MESRRITVQNASLMSKAHDVPPTVCTTRTTPEESKFRKEIVGDYSSDQRACTGFEPSHGHDSRSLRFPCWTLNPILTSQVQPNW